MAISPLLEKLFATLQQRQRPEDVAELIAELLGPSLTSAEAATLAKATVHSLKRNAWRYSAMLTQFAQPVSAGKQLRKAAELFIVAVPSDADLAEPAVVEQFLAATSPLLGKAVGADSFLHDRLNRAARRAAGLEHSRRRYNKLFRCLVNLSNKLQRILAEGRKLEFQLVAKHGFAHRIPVAAFTENVDVAAFTAYYTARCNLRSQFTIDRQERPFDEIAAMLLHRCERSTPSVEAWRAVALVYPDTQVLRRLTDAQRGELLGEWTKLLQEVAGHLEQIWHANTFRRATMIVKRGDDSSTWNAAAAAWNKARDNWLNLIYALGLDAILDAVCFGKVLRLMAADVVAWHHAAGNTLDPNTQVWAELPLPWEVFAGSQQCGRAEVTAACQRAGLDMATSGWLTPRPHGVAAFSPTPELVHGVSVGNPYLASVLRRHRYFSGKHRIMPLTPEDN